MTVNNAREWDARLQELVTPKGVVRMDERVYRRTGATFRQVMWSLLRASSAPDQRVLNMSLNRYSAQYAFQMACDATGSISRLVDPLRRRITFPNKSYVDFRGVEDDPANYAGTRWDSIARDY